MGNQHGIGEVSTPQSNVPDVDLNNLTWEEYRGTIAYKLNPGEEAIFVPLEEPRSVRNGTAWVVRAKILRWQGQGNVQPNGEATVYMQTLLAKAVMTAIEKYGVGNAIVYAKNMGRAKGKMYYDFEIKIARLGK